MPSDSENGADPSDGGGDPPGPVQPPHPPPPPESPAEPRVAGDAPGWGTDHAGFVFLTFPDIGEIRFNHTEAPPSLEFHCFQGHGFCCLSRAVTPAARGRLGARAAQGRPMGLGLAWLFKCKELGLRTRAEHKNPMFMASLDHDSRVAAILQPRVFQCRAPPQRR